MIERRGAHGHARWRRPRWREPHARAATLGQADDGGNRGASWPTSDADWKPVAGLAEPAS